MSNGRRGESPKYQKNAPGRTQIGEFGSVSPTRQSLTAVRIERSPELDAVVLVTLCAPSDERHD